MLDTAREVEGFDAAASIVVYEDPTFVVLASGVSECAHGHMTVLPKAHVSVLTELTAEDMSSVLAGLSRLVQTIKEAQDAQDVQVVAHPELPERQHEHLHFHLVPEGAQVRKDEDVPATAFPPKR